MIHNKYIHWAVSVILTLATACTESDMLRTDLIQASGKPHTYRLSIDMPVPSHDGQTTRVNTEWEDGSKVEFTFYTYVDVEKRATGLGGSGYAIVGEYYHSVSGYATYISAKNEWLLELEEDFPSNRTMTDCEVRYYQPQSDYDNEFMTAVYYGTTSYDLDGDQIICDAISLKPVNWRLRFKGEIGAHLCLCETKTDIKHNIGTPVHTSSITGVTPMDHTVPLTDTIPLTVASDGYTPYIFGNFENKEGDNTITIETGGQIYTRTISGTALKPSETGYIVIPTESNYETEGWTIYAFDTEELQFSSEESSITFKVLSNSLWSLFAGNIWRVKSVNEPMGYRLTLEKCDWITLSEESGENEREIIVTVKANTTTEERRTTIYLFESKDIKTEPPLCGLEVKQAGKGNDEGILTITVNGVSFKMVRVEGGRYTLTAENDHRAYNHIITLTNDYFIGETEVTQELWKAIMGEMPPSYNNLYSPNQPISYVSWKDCQEFIEKLNTYSIRKFRLPTVAEWLYAAKGGNKSKSYTFSGGNSLYDVAWDTGIHEVKMKSPNELGLYDMSGNILEWCEDSEDASFWENTSEYTNPKVIGDNIQPHLGYRERMGGGEGKLTDYCRTVLFTGSKYQSAYKYTIDVNTGFRITF